MLKFLISVSALVSIYPDNVQEERYAACHSNLGRHLTRFTWTFADIFKIFPDIAPLHHKQAVWWPACSGSPLILNAGMCWWREYLSVGVLLEGPQEDKSLQQQLDFPECFLHTCNSTSTAGLRSKIMRVIHWTRWMAVKQYIHVPSSYT